MTERETERVTESDRASDRERVTRREIGTVTGRATRHTTIEKKRNEMARIAKWAEKVGFTWRKIHLTTMYH